MAGRPLRGRGRPGSGYTIWIEDREVIELAILVVTAEPYAVFHRIADYLNPGNLCESDTSQEMSSVFCMSPSKARMSAPFPARIGTENGGVHFLTVLSETFDT